LIEPYGPEDLTIVLSDHGFGAGAAIDRLTGIHEVEEERSGLLFARGKGIRAGTQVEDTTGNDITPTVLAWLGLPVGEDMDGRPAAFIGPRRVRSVPTYDGKPVERVQIELSARRPRPSAVR